MSCVEAFLNSMSIQTVAGKLQGQDLRIAVVATRFNELVLEGLIKGAVGALTRHGVSEKDIVLVHVPGAWELPLAVSQLTASRRFDAVVALAAVIRGETPHFEYVAGECSKGLGQAVMQNRVPVGFGVLTTDSIDQALARAGGKAGNKGAEAAVAAIEMVNLLRQLEG